MPGKAKTCLEAGIRNANAEHFKVEIPNKEMKILLTGGLSVDIPMPTRRQLDRVEWPPSEKAMDEQRITL